MSSQKGNVLFLILIAIALFAALSYAVSSSTRSGSSGAPSEKDKTNAARVLSFASAMQITVQRLMTVNAVPITDLKFNSDIYKRIDGALIFPMDAPTDPSLYVFHPSGGGLAPVTFEDISVDCPTCPASNLASGHVSVVWVNVPNVGTTASDAYAFIGNLNEATCLAINQMLGISFIPVTASSTVYWGTLQGTSGPVAYTPLSGPVAADANAMSGSLALCIKGGSTGRYVFYSLLKQY